MMHKEQETPLFTISEETSWHFERILKPDDKTIGSYVLIKPGAADIAKVLTAYFHHPVPAYNIASIEIIYNEQSNRVFFGNMSMTNSHKGNIKYTPSWRWFELTLMLPQIESNKELAEEGKLYLKADGSYISRYNNKVYFGSLFEGEFSNLKIDMLGFDQKLSDLDFKDLVLEVTSKRGHTQKKIPRLEKQNRQNTHQLFQALTESHRDPNVPNMSILPLWHGTSDDVAKYIFDMGYGIFIENDPAFVTDEGYFGKGVYTAHEAEYSFRSYAQKHGDKAVLLLNWVSSFEAYPVIHGDMPKLRGKIGGFDKCDAHFIPVRSDKHPRTDVYVPCKINEPHHYQEMVVFSSAQCLPRYRVKLLKSAPLLNMIFDNTAYQMGLDCLGLAQYGMVAEAFENAYDAGNPAASIRLHWLHSGASGVVPANGQELIKYQNPQKITVEYLKHKANFRGENDLESQFNLAWCYQHGLGTPANPAKAAQYYWLAARQGHREAQYQLGVCCSTGTGVKQDMKKAIFYYEQAAAKGHVHANYLLSQCYELRLGAIPNEAKASHYKQAAQKGHHPKLSGMLSFRMDHSETKLRESESKLVQAEKALQVAKDEALSLQLQLQEYQKHSSKPVKISDNPFTTFQPMPPIKPSFQPTLQDQKDVEMLFKWVTEGHLLEAEKILQKNPNLALVKGTFTDLSGRRFRNTSAFQYAAWALDIEMCELMLKQLDASGAGVADIQLNELEKNPGSHGSHYDIDPLCQKMQKYTYNYNILWDQTKREQYWQKKVGGEQRKCPAWLIYAWCEKGADVAWVKKDLKNIKVIRQYHEGHLKWWFEAKYNNGCGVGSAWAIFRGPYEENILRARPKMLEGGSWAWDYDFLYHDIIVGGSLKSNLHEALKNIKSDLENKSTMCLKK